MPWQADVHDLVLVDASVTRAHTVDGWSVAEGVRARQKSEQWRRVRSASKLILRARAHQAEGTLAAIKQENDDADHSTLVYYAGSSGFKCSILQKVHLKSLERNTTVWVPYTRG